MLFQLIQLLRIGLLQGVQIGWWPLSNLLNFLFKFERGHDPMSIYRISCSWFWVGLVGNDCKKESAEKREAEAGGQHDVARRKGCFKFGFGFVGHGFGFSVGQSYNAFTLLRPL
jgi:hypothetical protein